MDEILVGKSYVKQIHQIVNSVYDDGDYKHINMSIYSSEKFNDFILHIECSCEHQCNREGHSFFKFTSYSDLIEFIYNDEDTIPFTWDKEFELQIQKYKFNL